MKVVKITPRGYCYGVVDAMVLASQVAKQPDLPRPIYILGMIVHNQYVVEAFEKQSIITLDGDNRLEILEQIDHGTVIFTAHGVSPAVRERAHAKGLTVIDATCPDVTRTHRLIEEKVAIGYDVVYIGKHGHPEPEGAMGVSPDHVFLVEKSADVVALPADLGRRDGVQGVNGQERIIVTNQTTMSQWDIAELVDEVTQRFPRAEVFNEICDATQVRQNAVATQAKGADLCLVVGDPRSNNSGRLAQVATEIAGIKAYRIADITEIQLEWLEGVETVAVTSGASTPTPITRAVVDFLLQFDPLRPETFTWTQVVDYEHLLPTGRMSRD
ncbi:MAG: 4-hydroxy-3-methylbut-2-enyl diphosphate reductase [Acidibacillus sp.]|nr:4-hydroxy-3-methylbut-2-enyl diphosphate reductase [Acidibacillus sp.]